MGCDKHESAGKAHDKHESAGKPEEERKYWGIFPAPPLSVESEAQHTMEAFRNVSTGQSTLQNAFEEVNNERRRFGLGTEKEKLFTERVHDKLIKENLLPEMSLKYAKENFQGMSDGEFIDQDTMRHFRIGTYHQMTPIERSMNHYLMQHYDELKDRTTPGNGTHIGMEDLDLALQDAQTNRADTSRADFETNELISALSANNFKLLKKLRDGDAGGITRETLDNSLETDGYRPKYLSREDRIAVNYMMDHFDELANNDESISNIDLKTYGTIHHVDTSAIDR